MFQIDLVSHRNDFTVVVVAAGCTHVVWTLQLAAIWAFVWVARNQCVMRAMVVAARFGYFVLLDSHVATYQCSGPQMGRYTGLAGTYARLRRLSNPKFARARENREENAFRKRFFADEGAVSTTVIKRPSYENDKLA